jgi:uncharacterized coiled-coil protein SlyX
MEARVTELEIKVSYLERLIGELDGVIRTMSDELEILRREVARLRALDDADGELPPNEKPPHY